MEHGVYCVYDSKAEAYIAPFCASNDAVCMRQLSEIVNSDSGHVFAKHPSDFTLFRLGWFSEETGNFNLQEAKSNLCVLAELKETDSAEG